MRKCTSDSLEDPMNETRNGRITTISYARRMDELVRLAPYMGLFRRGRNLILENWNEPLGKSWVALKKLVKEEQRLWPGKWKAFEDFGTEAAKQLKLE